MKQPIIFTFQVAETLSEVLSAYPDARLFVLTDRNTERLCWPRVSQVAALQGAKVITIEPGDEHKTLESLSHVWQSLVEGSANRRSVLVNLGGGMVTDLGGLAASTFKRGIAFINIPTTLLSMIDASVGGKTGINFQGLKNEIGVFRMAESVIVSSEFLSTLSREQILSGYAEMLKHSLLESEPMWAELVEGARLEETWCEVKNSPTKIEGVAGEARRGRLTDNEETRCEGARCEDTGWVPLLRDSIAVKERIVEADPTEQGLRKALNLGHTVGHAIESLALKRGRPIEHGYAVAAGLVAELYLSTVLKGFPTEQMRQTSRFVFEQYGRLPITCDDYPELLSLMHHDKKNTSANINFTLLQAIGKPLIDQTATEDDILEALDFYREG